MKRVVIAGGSGFLGTTLTNHFVEQGVAVTILTRGRPERQGLVTWIRWDGETIGKWCDELEGCDVLINLNGKSVDCRYTETNKSLIYSTRLKATAVLGVAVQRSANPPRLWINSSSATIYRHSLDKDMDEKTGEYGTGFSVDVCQKWESEFAKVATPKTRKVIIRTAIVLGKNGGALQPLKALAKVGLGGKQGSGKQYFSWLHENDFMSIIDFIIANEDMEGTYNLASPLPVPNEQVMKLLRQYSRTPFGIPMPAWLLALGAILIRTETELVLKSRRVVPGRLLAEGYQFKYSKLESALMDLCGK